MTLGGLKLKPSSVFTPRAALGSQHISVNNLLLFPPSEEAESKVGCCSKGENLLP